MKHLRTMPLADRVIAKRAWWSLYGGVLSGCCIRDRPVPFNNRECGDLTWPDEL